MRTGGVVLFLLCLVQVALSLAVAGQLFGVSNAGELMTIDTTTGRATVIGHTGYTLTDIAHSPAGELFGVAFGVSSNQLVRVDPSTGFCTEVGTIERGGVTSLTFSCDGSLYAARTNGELLRIDPATARSTVVGDMGFSAYGDLAFAPDGTLYGTSNSRLYRIDPNTAESTPVGEPTYFCHLHGLDFSPAGTLFAGCNTGSRLMVLDPSTGKAQQMPRMKNVGGGLNGLSFKNRCAESNPNLNLPPVAVFIAEPTSGSSPLEVSFNAVGSHDPDGIIVAYNWNYGDGTFGVGVAAVHTYETDSERTYVVELTVTDGEGRSASTSLSISVHGDQEASRGRPLAYVDYDWPAPNAVSAPDGFFNLDVELTIQNEAPPGYGLYWAHSFLFMDRTQLGYMGLQQGSPHVPGAGKLAIFAIWNALAAEEGPGCSCTYFDNEGEGWSCHVQYDWVEGRKYLLRIWTIAAESAPRGTAALDGQWWGAWVIDTVTGAETLIGMILAPSDWKWLSVSSVWGAEYFTLSRTGPCSDAPYAAAVFANPTANNGAFEPQHATVKYSVCPNANVSPVGERGALLETGGSTSRKTPKDSLLW